MLARLLAQSRRISADIDTILLLSMTQSCTMHRTIICCTLSKSYF